MKTSSDDATFLTTHNELHRYTQTMKNDRKRKYYMLLKLFHEFQPFSPLFFLEEVDKNQATQEFFTMHSERFVYRVERQLLVSDGRMIPDRVSNK